MENNKNKVMTVDGKLIDRDKACYLLKQHPKSDKILIDTRGVTYVKDENGTLRRFPQKEKKVK